MDVYTAVGEVERLRLALKTIVYIGAWTLDAKHAMAQVARDALGDEDAEAALIADPRQWNVSRIEVAEEDL